MIISFEQTAFEDYQNWAKENKKLFKKISELIKDIIRSPFDGLGKPEPLKGNLSGYWSRRINSEHRLVYKYQKERVLIVSCKYHYE